MQKPLPERNRKKITHIKQISEDHCGPAVIEMLLDNLGYIFTQEEITSAAGAEKTIKRHGTRVDQLALAVHRLTPQLCFWYKERSTIRDLRTVIKDFHFPVGVEWQGLFEDDLDDEDDDEDYGHYSIVSHIDDSKRQIIIVDPYKTFVKQDRIVPIKLFRQRWWDWNEVVDPETGEAEYKIDDRLFFLISDKNMDFPEQLGMKRFNFPDA